jgi:VanZ family protein
LSSSVIGGKIGLTPGRILLRWLPTLAWLCLLAAFSTDSFSAENTGSILWKIVHALYGGISEEQFEVLHIFVRKAAHFIFYGLLSVFAYYSWKATLPARRIWTFRWGGLALAATLIAGSLDEFHQVFVPSRTASVRDVLLDVTGALFFQILIAAFAGRRRKSSALQAALAPPESVPAGTPPPA